MADTIDIEVKGLIEAEKKVAQIIRDLHGEATLKTMRDATLIVTGAAKKNAPVDTGRLRASITPSVRMDKDTTIGVVGSNVVYSAFMEFGTRPHWPPISALEVWAQRHGIEAFLVARAISRHGTAARKYLQRAFDDNKARIVRVLENGIHKIVEKK